jgi:hypothetical protein
MRCFFFVLLLAVVAFRPIALDPLRPTLYAWRNATVALVGSSEHYGAILNTDFDFVAYLDAVAASHLTLVRAWTGAAYVEPPGAFNIANNTLAPAPGAFLAPWARSTECCYNNDTRFGNKFNLSAYNPAYFSRLRAFLSAASARGIAVNLGLFSFVYTADIWALSPLNARNNVNGVGARVVDYRRELFTLKWPDITDAQMRFLDELGGALAAFDNFWYEMINGKSRVARAAHAPAPLLQHFFRPLYNPPPPPPQSAPQSPTPTPRAWAPGTAPPWRAFAPRTPQTRTSFLSTLETRPRASRLSRA